MTSQQYEAFCQFFIARQLGIPFKRVVSRTIAAPGRDGPAGYGLQVDLYWETENGLARYVNIANAKWRSRRPVIQEDVLLLQKIKEKVGAHKAFLITNTGFTRGAIKAAKADGIGLLIARPEFDYSTFPPWPEYLIGMMADMCKGDKPPYSFEAITKGFEPTVPASPVPCPAAVPAASGPGAPVPHPTHAALCTPPAVPGSGSPTAGGATYSVLGTYATRQGPGPAFRTK